MTESRFTRPSNCRAGRTALARRSLVVLACIAALSGCTELRARRHAREGNRLFADGNYPAAVQEYAFAERLLPTLSTIALNKGLACRQLMVPGAKTKEAEGATDCALDSFDRLKKLSPKDPRGDQLYVQTLFDGDRFDTLKTLYSDALRSNPNNLEAINGLIQVSSRADRWDEALGYMTRRAEIEARDAEAQYSAGVFIWSRLFQKGGSGDRGSFDPRPEAKQIARPFGEDDVVGDERVRLADLGISFLEKALAIRPKYHEAMTYLNLLYRQKSYAFFDQPDKWKDCVDRAVSWQQKSMEVDLQQNRPEH